MQDIASEPDMPDHTLRSLKRFFYGTNILTLSFLAWILSSDAVAYSILQWIPDNLAYSAGQEFLSKNLPIQAVLAFHYTALFGCYYFCFIKKHLNHLNLLMSRESRLLVLTFWILLVVFIFHPGNPQSEPHLIHRLMNQKTSFLVFWMLLINLCAVIHAVFFHILTHGLSLIWRSGRLSDQKKQ